MNLTSRALGPVFLVLASVVFNPSLGQGRGENRGFEGIEDAGSYQKRRNQQAVFQMMIPIRGAQLAGQQARIAEGEIQFSSGEVCQLSEPEELILRNDRSSFGSFAGSWSRVGFFPNHEAEYVVENYYLDCPDYTDGLWSITGQPGKDNYVFEVGHFFAN